MAFRRIQSHGDVCGNCFQRTHHTFERNYAVDVVDPDPEDPEFWFRQIDAPDRPYPVDRRLDSVPGDLPTEGVYSVCKCGYPPGEQRRPLPKSLFFEYARNLRKRYSEFGIPLHEPTFWTELEALKSDPSEQFADDRLYEEATIRAIIHEWRL